MANESSPSFTAIQIFDATDHKSTDLFYDFPRYIEHMESCGAHKAGLAKIIPPNDWKPNNGKPCDVKKLMGITLEMAIEQKRRGCDSIYQLKAAPSKVRTVEQLYKTAEKFRSVVRQHDRHEEEHFWKNILTVQPTYGVDVPQSLFNRKSGTWTLQKLNTILDDVAKDSGKTIDGLNTPYLYVGMRHTCFAWHTEDMDLHSINYLHFGEPKTWYVIPPQYGNDFEKLINDLLPKEYEKCASFLRHKTVLTNPDLLTKNGIPFNKV